MGDRTRLIGQALYRGAAVDLNAVANQLNLGWVPEMRDGNVGINSTARGPLLTIRTPSGLAAAYTLATRAKKTTQTTDVAGASVAGGSLVLAAAAKMDTISGLAVNVPSQGRAVALTSGAAEVAPWVCADMYTSVFEDSLPMAGRASSLQLPFQWPEGDDRRLVTDGFPGSYSNVRPTAFIRVGSGTRPGYVNDFITYLQALAVDNSDPEVIDLGDASPRQNQLQLSLTDLRGLTDGTVEGSVTFSAPNQADALCFTAYYVRILDGAQWPSATFQTPVQNLGQGSLPFQSPVVRLLARTHIIIPGGWWRVGRNVSSATADTLVHGVSALLDNADICSPHFTHGAIDAIPAGVDFILINMHKYLNTVFAGSSGPVISHYGTLSINIW